MTKGSELFHKPVMLNEVKDLLCPKDGGMYLDCTFGFGGYSKMILEASNCELYALDRDPNVRIYADQLMNDYPTSMNFIQIDFADSFSKISSLKLDKKFDGIVMDLGVSSMQIDSGDRGFSFTHDGPLDMRMSLSGISAADFINQAEEHEIADVIYKYGDESFSRRIAKNIVIQRKIEPIVNTARLANIIRTSIGFKKGKIDTATKSFQAIRIHINDELGQLVKFLANCRNICAANGRIIIVSFHSLEDRIVKNFFKENSAKLVARSKYAASITANQDAKEWLKILTKKPLSPSSAELTANPRARSAKLRAGQNIGNQNVS